METRYHSGQKRKRMVSKLPHPYATPNRVTSFKTHQRDNCHKKIDLTGKSWQKSPRSVKRAAFEGPKVLYEGVTGVPWGRVMWVTAWTGLHQGVRSYKSLEQNGQGWPILSGYWNFWSTLDGKKASKQPIELWLEWRFLCLHQWKYTFQVWEYTLYEVAFLPLSSLGITFFFQDSPLPQCLGPNSHSIKASNCKAGW